MRHDVEDMDDPKGRLLRSIWSHPSCVLAVFVGSSAEFAVNPAAEWLFYTGRLPADPVGRFVSTTRYTGRLIFASTDAEFRATVGQIRSVHTALEKERGHLIPEEAYMDVLFMNIEYSMRAFQLVFGRRLSDRQRSAIVEEFRRVGELMGIAMPEDVAEYQVLRAARLEAFKVTEWTPQLMEAYRRALGTVRFFVLQIVYGAVVDPCVLKLLDIKPGYLARVFGWLCPYICKTPLEGWLIRLVLPARMTQALNGCGAV